MIRIQISFQKILSSPLIRLMKISNNALALLKTTKVQCTANDAGRNSIGFRFLRSFHCSSARSEALIQRESKIAQISKFSAENSGWFKFRRSKWTWKHFPKQRFLLDNFACQRTSLIEPILRNPIRRTWASEAFLTRFHTFNSMSSTVLNLRPH